MCWVVLQAPGLRGGGRVRGRCFGAMATGMTSCTLKSKISTAKYCIYDNQPEGSETTLPVLA
jgi:hypothetical protein